MTKSQSRPFVALLALVVTLTMSACSSPTGPDPVVTQPGPPVADPPPPSVRPVGQIRGFDLKPFDPEHPTWGGQAGSFTKTSDPLKVLLFMKDEANYNLWAAIYVYDGGAYGAKLAEGPIVFSGKQAQTELSYDSSQCVYKNLATGELQCMLILFNRDSEKTAFGDARMEGVPIR